jgi:ATP-dependent DNA ligase
MGKFIPGRTEKLFPISSIEAKLDGLRCLIYKDPDTKRYIALSRQQKFYNNVGYILNELKPLLDAGFVLDGELLAGDVGTGTDWNKTISVVHTKSKHPGTASLKFYVFDMLTNSEAFKKRGSVIGYKERRLRMLNALRKYVPRAKFTRPVERFKVKQPEDIHRVFQDLISQGYEGGMAKSDRGMYGFEGKPAPWFKLKPIETFDYKITGIQMGKGKYTHTIGAVEIDVDGAKTFVGSGIDDKVRAEMWDLYRKGKLIGMTAEVSFQEKTLGKGRLRFPTFIRLRTDLGVEGK